MLIDPYIAALVKLRQQHGPELDVVRANPETGGFAKAGLPRVQHVSKKNPRTLFRDGTDLDQFKGRKVVRL